MLLGDEMAVIRQGGSNPYTGKVMTTQGLKDHRAPVCTNCRQRKEGQLYTVNANGQIVCADCSGSYGIGILKGVCDEDECTCDRTDPACGE